MNLRQVEAFCLIVERGSFSLAADELGLSQPAVSFQIQSLEKELGVTLLDRSARGVSTTESGRIFYEHGREMLRQLERARQKMNDLDELLRGTLLIGASTGPGEHVLPQLLGEFKAAHPHIDVVLRISPTARIIAQVLDNNLEIGVVGAQEPNPRLSFEPFIQDRLIVIAPPEHRWAERASVTVDDLMREPFVLQQQGAGVRSVLESGLKRMGLQLGDLNVQMELGLQESIKTAVEAGHGVGIISRCAVRQELRFGTLVEVQVEDLPSFRDEFYLVRSRTRDLSRVTEAFLGFAQARLDALGVDGGC